MRLRILRLVASGTLGLAAVLPALDAHSAKLTNADRAWIDSCVAARKASQPGQALRRYCVCMHGIVAHNRTFEITELERTYPPAHLMCWKKSGRRS